LIESTIERATYKALKAAGYLCIKQTARKGVLDRLCISPQGDFFFVEFKAPGNTTSHHQDLFIEDMKRRGVKTIVAYSKADVLDYARRLDNA
jgi:hypothetical protein